MSELDDHRRERLLDSYLNQADQWDMPPAAQVRRAAEADPAVAEDLALIAKLRDIWPSRDETEFARLRTAQRLEALMRDEPGPTLPLPPQETSEAFHARLRAMTMPPRTEEPPARERPPQRVPARAARVAANRPWMRRASTLVAAALLLAFASLAGASAVSAQALPESPLYSVKRIEESTLLAISWGDTSRGQALTMIAGHRLVEASAENALRRPLKARSLLGEFDVVFAQLIDLTSHAEATHEDVTSLTTNVQATLESAKSLAATANASGDTTFAQEVGASAAAATAHIEAAGIDTSATPSHGKGNGGGQGSQGQQTPQPMQTPKPTHTPKPGQGASATTTVTPSATLSVTPVTLPSATASAGSGNSGNHSSSNGR